MRHVIVFVSMAFLPLVAFAAGEDNPSGVAGISGTNQIVNTGGSYLVYSGSAQRAVTDLSVRGAVAGYGLSFTRFMNSWYVVSTNNAPAFGQAGTWTHNWQWGIEDIVYYAQPSPTSPGNPSNYVVNYPDGRRINFSSTRSGDPDKYASGGIRDRFEPNSNGVCYLRMADGGRVKFISTRTVTQNEIADGVFNYDISWTFAVDSITDPFGQTLSFTHPADGSLTITEPAGRMLKIFNKVGPTGDTVVDRVEERMSSIGSATRTVTYNYSSYNGGGTLYSALTGVTYYDGTAAAYTYQNNNVSATGRPLIKTCIDPMFAGPMWRIAYVFSGTSVAGQMGSENYFDGTNYPGTPISSLAYGTNTRTETRGDGAFTRTFTFSSAKLTAQTDFNNVSMSVAEVRKLVKIPLSRTDQGNDVIMYHGKEFPFGGKNVDIAFYFVGGKLLRLGFEIPYDSAVAIVDSLKEKYGPVSSMSDRKAMAAVDTTPNTEAYVAFDHDTVIWKVMSDESTQQTAIVIYTSPDFDRMLMQAQKKGVKDDL